MKSLPRCSVCAVLSAGLVGSASARPDLHNNGPFVTSPNGGAGGAPLSMLQSSMGGTSHGYNHQKESPWWRVADDFVITDPAGWTISSIVVYSFQTNAGTEGSPLTHMNLRVWSGRPGTTGSTILFGDTTTNRLGASSWTGCFRAPETNTQSTTRAVFAVEALVNPPLHLNPGTYWLDWQASTVTWQVQAVPVTILGLAGAPNANARSFEGQTGIWSNLKDGGNAVQQELAFIVRGSIGSGGGPVCYANCDASTAVPFLNVNDFVCFSNRFAAGDTRANCDGSTTSRS